MTLLLAGVPVGLATGVFAWFAAGGASANVDRLAPAGAALDGMRAPRPRDAAAAAFSLRDLRTAPLFPLTVGPGAVKEASVRLDGVSVTSRRTAALVSIDGKPPEWLLLGETRDGITLQQVVGSRVVIDTVLGPKEVALGEQTAPGGAASVAAPPTVDPGPAPQAAVVDQIPPGFRSPPPPASAPR